MLHRHLNPDLQTPAPKRNIAMLRIMWAALLMGQFAFAAAVAVIITQNRPQPLAPDLLRIFFIMSAAMLVILLPLAFLVRALIFRRNQLGGTIRPGPYATANLLFWAACEATSFFSLIVALLHGSFWPTILVTLLAMAAQIATFPQLRHLQAPGETFKID